jgi:hypothetical protein
MIFHDIKQNTEEWLQLRCGKLTGSNFGKIMANQGAAFGDEARKLAVNIAAERITGTPILCNFRSNHMERGHQQEPVARSLYEQQTFTTVQNGGFFDCGKIGCSPDGLVDQDGIIEIKSVIATTHFETISRQSFDPAYKWQLIGNLYHTQRAWIDFISYCADFPADRQLFICTLEAHQLEREFEQLVNREEHFFKLVDEYQSIILESEYEVNHEQCKQSGHSRSSWSRSRA